MVGAETSGHLLGRDDRAVRRWGSVAVALSLGSLGLFSAVKALGYPTIHLVLWWEGYALLLTGLIVVQSYSDGGLALSWLLAFGATVGAGLNYGGVGVTGGGPSLLELVGIALVGGMGGAATLGTLGFGLGVVLRRIVG